MLRKIGKVTYDTENSSIVNKVTFSYYGDPKGYEETLYVDKKGHYFLYTYGGAESKYVKEKITPLRKERAQNYM